MSPLKMAELTISTVESIKSGEKVQMFFFFFFTTLKKTKQHDYIGEPTLPRKRKNPNYSTIEHSIGYEEHGDPYYPSPGVERYR